MPAFTQGLRQILQPLVGRAGRVSIADRNAWLDDLRLDAPVSAEVLAILLAEPRCPREPRPSPAKPRDDRRPA
jgi:hypothetical protein